MAASRTRQWAPLAVAARRDDPASAQRWSPLWVSRGKAVARHNLAKLVGTGFFFPLWNYLNVHNVHALWFICLDILLKLPNQQYSSKRRKQSNICISFLVWTFTKLGF